MKITRRDKAPTVEQMRHDIDRGLTGEKVDFPDPALVPLGADAEAGGARATEAERRGEAARMAKMRPSMDHRQDTASWPYWAIAVAVGVILASAIAFFA